MLTFTIFNNGINMNGNSSGFHLRWLMIITTIVSLLTTSPITSVSAQEECPPPEFDALKEFDRAGFIAHRWYSIKQTVPIPRQSQFYCVYTKYAPKRFQSLYCLLYGCKPTISVFNFARRWSVYGIRRTVRLEATFTNEKDDPAKALRVPKFIPVRARTGSNYWVVAAGIWSDLPGVLTPPDTGNVYDWAILTTGSPTSVGITGKCYSGDGMYVYSQTPAPPEGAMESIDIIADALGLDNKEWTQVEHTGCRYRRF